MSMTKWVGSIAGLLAGTFASAVAHAETARSQYNLPVGVTEISAQVHWLHMVILGVVTVIGILVFGAMIYSIINHRRSKHPKPADFHESVAVEIAWTIIPFFILIGMAVPAAGLLIKMEDTSKADLTVKVTGFQWGWKYEYVGENYEFVSMLSSESNAARRPGRQQDHRGTGEGRWRQLPVERQQSAGAADRQEDPLPDHRPGRDPRLVGA